MLIISSLKYNKYYILLWIYPKMLERKQEKYDKISLLLTIKPISDKFIIFPQSFNYSY